MGDQRVKVEHRQLRLIGDAIPAEIPSDYRRWWWTACVADASAVGIQLIRVVDERTVVTEIPDSVLVDVGLVGVRYSDTVVNCVADRVCINVVACGCPGRGR